MANMYSNCCCGMLRLSLLYRSKDALAGDVTHLLREKRALLSDYYNIGLQDDDQVHKQLMTYL
jgi:hypothetical protein